MVDLNLNPDRLTMQNKIEEKSPHPGLMQIKPQ